MTISQDYSGVNVLVTGVTGFIGSHLLRKLVEYGAIVAALIRPTAPRHRIEDVASEVTLFEANLEDYDAVAKAVTISHPQIAFHLAAHGVGQVLGDVPMICRANVLGTVHLLKALEHISYERFIFAGTCHEYGNYEGRIREESSLNPQSAYAASKTAAWAFCNAYFYAGSHPVLTLRPVATYGPDDEPSRLIPQVITYALRGEDIPLTGGEQKRDFLFIDDVVEGFLRAGLAQPFPARVINLASGQEYTVSEIVAQILRLTGSQSRPLFSTLPYGKGELWHASYDTSVSRCLLGWEPKTSFEEGLRRTISWHQQY
ncbi:MAG: NAD-dependent epimerase/dehydratase family protein [Dehalococcoidia bacterium]|nr:NAD-dependent epimerase/dehydratase family protein [Dehalococcoidia bacterium]